MMQLFLYCDGVLADFDRGATDLLGMAPRAFWREIARHPDFYGTLPLMDAAAHKMFVAKIDTHMFDGTRAAA